MSTSIDRTYQARPFHCKGCDSVLGYTLRDSQRIRRLYILTTPLRSDEELPPQDVIVSAATDPKWHLFRVIGMDSGTVCCDACGARTEWNASEEAMKEILLRARGRWGVREFERLMREVRNG